jgi:hypothetical protein
MIEIVSNQHFQQLMLAPVGLSLVRGLSILTL